MTTSTDAAVSALRVEINSIDQQLRGADTSEIDAEIARLQERIRELRAARKSNPKAKEMRRRRGELTKAIALITGAAEPAPPKRRLTGGGECTICGLSFPSAQGLSMHRRRAHEGMGPGRHGSDAPPARDPGRAVNTLHDHRQPLAEPVSVEEATGLIEAAR